MDIQNITDPRERARVYRRIARMAEYEANCNVGRRTHSNKPYVRRVLAQAQFIEKMMGQIPDDVTLTAEQRDVVRMLAERMTIVTFRPKGSLIRDDDQEPIRRRRCTKN